MTTHLLSFDASQLKRTRTVQHSAGLFSCAFDSASGRLVAGAIDGRILTWGYPDFADPTPFAWQHRSYVYALAALPKQRLLVSAGYDKKLVWWDPIGGVPLRETNLPGRPQQIAASADERTLAVVDDDRRLLLFDVESGELRAQHVGHAEYTPKMLPSTVYAVAFSPHGEWVATGDRGGTVLVRETSTGVVVRSLSAPRFYADFRVMPDGKPADGEYELGGVRMLAFAPDGRTLIVGGMADYDPNSAATDGKMGIVAFDVATGNELFATKLAKDQGYLQAACFHPSGLLAAAGGGGTAGDAGVGALCVFDLAKPDAPTVHSLEMTVRGLAFSPGADAVLVVGMHKKAVDGQIEVWSLPKEDGTS